MSISNEKIYQIIEQMNSNISADVLPENLLKSIEKGFQKLDKLDHVNSPNFVNFVVEQYRFFSSCKNIFDRVKQMCTILMNSNQLSSKVIGITSQTKLWLQAYRENQGIEQFIEFLYKNATDTNLNNMDNPPHLRSVYSQCLLEIYYALPDRVNLTPEQVIETTNSTLIPTSFPELAFAMKGESPEIEEYIQKRWWSLSPTETAFFAPTYVPPFPATPNDPLLLHTAMVKKMVPKETALTLINSPFSQSGVQNVLFEFKDSFEFDGGSLFTPYDNNELIAAKSLLLPSTIQSIQNNSILADFVNQGPDSSIVLAVFSIASRFGPEDLFSFYRNYFEKTPSFDKYWFELYNKQPQKVQASLRCFLQRFPDRLISAKAILSSDLPTLTAINQVNDKNAAELAPLLKNSCSNIGSIESAYSIGKLDSLLSNESIGKTVKESIEKSNKAQTNAKENSFQQIKEIEEPPFLVIDQDVSTSNMTMTKIALTIKYKPINDESQSNKPIYAITFTLSNNEYFAEPATISVPLMTDTAQVTFEMRPIKAGNCNLAMSCSYTTAEGEPAKCTMNFLILTIDMFLSPLEKDFDPSMVDGEESRRVLPIPFDKFEEKIKKYVFGKYSHNEENKKIIQTNLMTPDLHSISFEAVGIENETSVMFKAPTLELLSLIDEFLKNTFEVK